MSKADDQGRKVCVDCGVEKDISEFGIHSPGFRRANCKVCRRAAGVQFHKKNKDEINAKKREARAANVEYHRERNKQWYYDNHEKAKAKRAEWRAANPERMRAATAAWRAKHPDRQKAAEEAWRAANPWFTRSSLIRRRAQLAVSKGRLSRDIVQRLLALQRGRCACCGESLGDEYHLDHIMPLALGGANIDANMQLLRAICNLRKGAKHPVEYMQDKGFLL
ncbi:HNH endonuclease [Massilia sp. BHUDP2]|uniref:HNH endonuclease n=1 Tax=Massilia sp. BHUDP2 TaxID=3034505 RepID=UPI0039067A79